jgi:recombination protein RecR
MYASPIARLVQQLAKLPGIGEKTAARLAFHIVRAAPEDAAALAAAITDVKQRIRFCGVCFDLTEKDPCAICADARRDAGLVCVVAHPQDVAAIERAGGYRGRYHVLHGLLSPLDGIGPDDLRVAELIRRCGAGGGNDGADVVPTSRAKPPLSTSPSCCGRSACAPHASPPGFRSAASWSMPIS